MSLLNIFVIAIALSMDTFSLSLSLSLLIDKKNKLYLFFFLVSLFHFVLPLLGNKIGVNIIRYIPVSSNKVLGIIFIVLFIKLLIDLIFDKDKKINVNILSIILLAISVSIDSFITGIGIININMIYSLIISLVAGLFTFIGLIIGYYAKRDMGSIANYIGLLLLLLLSLFHLCK